MTCTKDLVEGLTGWLSTTAYKMCRGGYLDRDDLVNTAVVAVLQSGADNEGLAKTVAVRAMNKYRHRHGFCPAYVKRDGTKHFIVGRTEYPDLDAVAVDREPGGVLWDAVEKRLTPVNYEALRKWVESGESADEIGRGQGVPGRTVRYRIDAALRTLREYHGSKYGSP